MIYPLTKQCKICLGNAEYTLKDMTLCQYHYVKLNNDIATYEYEHHLRWLHE